MQNNTSVSMVRVTINRTCRFALFILMIAISQLIAIDEAGAEIINFNEYPAGTTITDQYRSLGVIFSGEPQPPLINPSGVALMGYAFPDGTGTGSIIATFVNPSDGTPAEATISYFFLTINYLLSSFFVTQTTYDINDVIISQYRIDINTPPLFSIPLPPKLHKIVITPTYANILIDPLIFQIVSSPCDLDPVCCNSKDPCCGNPGGPADAPGTK